MTLNDVTYDYHYPHHQITCTYQAISFRISVTCLTEETVVSSFQHGLMEPGQTCPFCDSPSPDMWCAGVASEPPALYEFLTCLFHHPVCRLPLLTETTINIDDPSIKLWVDPSQDADAYYSPRDMQRYVTEIETLAIHKQVKLLYIRPDFRLFVAERGRETMYFTNHHPLNEWEMQPIERWQIVGIPGVYTLSFSPVLRLFLTYPTSAV